MTPSSLPSFFFPVTMPQGHPPADPPMQPPSTTKPQMFPKAEETTIRNSNLNNAGGNVYTTNITSYFVQTPLYVKVLLFVVGGGVLIKYANRDFEVCLTFHPLLRMLAKTCLQPRTSFTGMSIADC